MEGRVYYCEPSIRHVPREGKRLSGRKLLFTSQQGSVYGQAERIGTFAKQPLWAIAVPMI
jgi:hypothetical protein